LFLRSGAGNVLPTSCLQQWVQFEIFLLPDRKSAAPFAEGSDF
jgi:hypothetical protein